MRLVTITLCAVIMFFPGVTVTAAGIKCWTNEQGNLECGDVVPPKYAQQSHTEINEQGRVVNEVERAKTDEELEQERLAAEVEKKKQQLEQEQARLDQILLHTFSNVADIESARDGKIAAIESTIAQANRRNARIQTDLDERIKTAAAAERKGQAPGEDLMSDIESLQRQITNNNAFIEGKNQEKETLIETYAKDIERFKYLKSVKD